jgi:peroxiredoxin
MKSLLISAAVYTALAFGQEFRLGSKVGDFTLTDLSGKSVQFAELRGPVTVIIFIATRCPISNSYNQRMNAIFSDYNGKGVRFVFINSNSNEPASEVAQHARSAAFLFPVYKDPENRVADRFGAMATPESYVIDAQGAVRYHGYIDDSTNEARIKNRGLRNALDAVLAGKDAPAPETKAFGCTIKKVRRTT